MVVSLRQNYTFMSNVRYIPLLTEDVEPYASVSVARLFLKFPYIGQIKHGNLPCPRIENGDLIFRLGPIVKYSCRGARDFLDPGNSLLIPDDRIVRGSYQADLQRFQIHNPHQRLVENQSADTLCVPLPNGCAVVFSIRPHDIEAVDVWLKTEATAQS